MTNTMWGGRFASSPSEIMEEINASIDFDKRLWRHDIEASKAHVAMLGATGIVTPGDAAKITEGLDQILAEIEGGTFKFSRALEDIHLNVENRLKEIIGPAAGKLHTARSRNDQVATDFRLYVRDEIGVIEAGLAQLQLALATQAVEEAATTMPGFTHLQTAQPVTFGHHCLAYVEMSARPGPLHRCRQASNECPLDRQLLGARRIRASDRPPLHTAKARLQFDRPTANSLILVSDRTSPCGKRRRGLYRRDALVAAIRGDRAVDLAAVLRFARLSDAFSTVLDHAAEANPDGPSSCARRPAASPVRSRPCSW